MSDLLQDEGLKPCPFCGGIFNDYETPEQARAGWNKRT